MASKIFEEAMKKVKPENEAFVRMSIGVVKRIQKLMEVKKMNQTELAQALGKSPSEVSKWLSGMHNFTLKSIAKLEVILGAPVLAEVIDHPIDEKEVLGKISSLKEELDKLERMVAKAS